MSNDSVADLITRIKNASIVKKATVSVPFSNFKLAIAEKLREAGDLRIIEKRGKKVKKTLDLTLTYSEDGAPRIRNVKRISKPGRRVYRGAHEIRSVRYGRGTLLLSTPQGVITDKEARKAKVGGEALFEIW